MNRAAFIDRWRQAGAAERGALDLVAAKSAFKAFRADQVAAALDSLAALGLALGAGGGRRWSAVK